MKILVDGMQAALDSGVTTLCWCWRLIRRDGQIVGFTDHDNAVIFDDTTFEAESGFNASEISESVGLSVDNMEVEAALSSGRLSEPDLAAGIYDEARIEIFRVNWQQPEQRILVKAGSIGEVRRAGKAFSAEVRGLAHYLQQPSGRLYQYGCDADLGDGRCRVDLASSQFKGEGAVSAVHSPRTFDVTGLSGFDNDWFTRGLAIFTSGLSDGQRTEIKRHQKDGDTVRIELWQETAQVVAGDTFIALAGCDKSMETCQQKFANVLNFRGFPHMPGNDFVTSYVGNSDTISS